MDTDWTHTLTEQLDRHWRTQLRPRLDGLTDDEYLWEPVPGCWSLRRRDEATTPLAAGATALDAAALTRPVGRAEVPFADRPYAELLLHINREAIHHGAEIALLRDLYLRRDELRGGHR